MFVIFLTGNDTMLTVIPPHVIDHLQPLEMEPKSFPKVTTRWTPPPPGKLAYFLLLSVKYICPRKDSVVLMRA